MDQYEGKMASDSQTKASKSSTDSCKSVRDIDQLILNRQRKAEISRMEPTQVPQTTSLTKEFFEGLNIA